MKIREALAAFGTLYWSFNGDRVHVTSDPDACPQVADIPDEKRHAASDVREVPLYRELCRYCDPDVEIDNSTQRMQADLLRDAGFVVETDGTGGQVQAAREVADGD